MITGKIEFDKKLDKLLEVDLVPAVGKGIKQVREYAQSGCPSFDGELREKIKTDVEEDEALVRGVCWPDVKHGVFVELGTGPKGQADHDGISPEVTVSYTQEPWWIHEGPGENEIDRSVAEHYHFPFIDTPQGRFYKCSGQAAQPYLYPALKDNKDEILKIMGEEIKKQL